MPSVCAGYRAADDKPSDPPHQPEERFRPDGWFATGDEYLQDPDGFYHHRGRTGDMLDGRYARFFMRYARSALISPIFDLKIHSSGRGRKSSSRPAFSFEAPLSLVA